MAILFNNDGGRHGEWLDELRRLLPRHIVHEYPNIQNADDIDYAIVWNHPKGDLARYPNLKAVLSTGAGTEHFDQDDTLPKAPIYRLVDPAMAEDMALYVLYWTLHFQRHFSKYRAQATQQHWERHPSAQVKNVNICILGLGAIGGVIARRLASNGFNVTGWSRSQKVIDGVACLSGQAALYPALRTAHILVNCLPSKPSTEGFINRALLSSLPKGAALINVSRGAIIDDEALLEFLGARHVAEAALDVFTQEPLPSSSPYWAHPNVHVTPHMSGATNPITAAAIIAKSIQMIERGETPSHRYVP